MTDNRESVYKKEKKNDWNEQQTNFKRALNHNKEIGKIFGIMSEFKNPVR